MNMFKKLMKGVMTGALALTVIAGIGTVSASAESADPSASPEPSKSLVVGDEVMPGDSYGSRSICVYTGDVDTFYVAFPTVKSDKVVVKSWDVYATGTDYAIIDLSNLNATKDNYVALKTATKPDPIIIHYAANKNKLKITCTPKDGAAPEIKAESKATGAAYTLYLRAGAYGGMPIEGDVDYIEKKDGEEVSYERVVNSLISKEEYDAFAMQGATIYADILPDSDEIVDAKKTWEDKSDSNVKYKVYDAPFLSGVTAKFKIAKKANAPKVNIDYTKRIMKISDKMEYTTIGAGYKEGTYVTGSKTGVVPSANTTYFVRTAGKNGKAPSKVTPVIIGAMTATPTALNAPASCSTDDSIKVAEVTVGKDTKVVEVALDKDDKTYTFKNSTGLNIGLYYGTTAPADTAKGQKVLKTTDVKIKKTLIGTSNVYVRVEGDNKSKTFASAWVKLEKPAEESK